MINLATNDFGKRNPDEAKWVGAYEEFIARVRKAYPDAHIYCATGSMMSDSWPQEQKTLSRSSLPGKIVADEEGRGDKKVHEIDFDPQDPENGLGSDWHPSVKTHQLMAEKLVATLKKDLGWKVINSDEKFQGTDERMPGDRHPERAKHLFLFPSDRQVLSVHAFENAVTVMPRGAVARATNLRKSTLFGPARDPWVATAPLRDDNAETRVAISPSLIHVA